MSSSKPGPVPKRWVIKLGTGILSDPRGHIDFSQIDQLAAQVVELRRRGMAVNHKPGAPTDRSSSVGWKRVLRLMREDNLLGVEPKAFLATTRSWSDWVVARLPVCPSPLDLAGRFSATWR